ncbi:hypothetical protein CKM354_000039700 [Cercospora kikuchii]|uniref:PH domain-containing protein n=1 Tax=Cercospora kikuchii TaxID=84275 RepID=A0A9P3FAY8_9PEZI|nr:uncharacterized protein CKM354_000039700 [Cercospora kikuchii]GIZ36932.1 hypothetical protein CKM354_000039700 [Cercospora kikuchii]
MDLLAECPVQSSDTSTQDADYKLPALSRSQTTLHVTESPSPDGPPLPSPTASIPVSPSIASPTTDKRKSLRLRPTESLDRQHAEPLPLTNNPKTTTPPDLRPRTSKMSLFHLFSKPKVEKLRGYAETGLDAPPRGISNSDIKRPVRPSRPDAHNGKLQPSPSRTVDTPKIAKPMPEVSALPAPNERSPKMRTFEPPPLFQVWPQAIKSASFEVSTVTSDNSAPRSKNRMLGATLFVPGSDLQSLQMGSPKDGAEPRASTSTRAATRQSSVTASSLPTKLIVLVTSGYLLQYAATGPNDRYPEKMLQLQKESAAFASDLIPGKHHVLQVVQSVNEQGIMAAPSTGLLSRLGLRSQTARRTTTTFLLVMPGPEEMKNWMTTIRQEIERQGGKHIRSDSSTNRADVNASAKHDLKKALSLTHRYKVVRASSIPNLALAQQQAAEVSSPSQMAAEEHSAAEPERKVSEHQQSPVINDAPSPRPRANSDTPSTSSSVAPSENQKQLDKLRDSTRSSHASTMATTVGSLASRTNSMSSTPPVELLARDIHEPQQDYLSSKGPYRNLASYSLPKRRSNVPLPLLSEPLSPKAQALRRVEKSLDSPVLPVAQDRQVTERQNVPQLQHLSKSEGDVRPESFLGDLPDRSKWASTNLPGHKFVAQHASTSNPTLSGRALHSGQTRPLRNSSQSFSLPLRVNPSDSVSQRSVSSRSPRPTEADPDLRSPVPAATTLIAKVDPSQRTPSPSYGAAQRMSLTTPPAASAGQYRRVSPARYSLVPTGVSALPTISTASADALRRSPSMASVPIGMPPAQQSGPLRRPASLQVRTNHAPFLSSMRSSPVSPNTQLRVSTTPPIRSLKPSRSANLVPNRSSSIAVVPTYEEEGDEAMPLPVRSDSPPKAPLVRKVRTSTSLPMLDLGIPLVGLGPPAPPPQAPLPELPPASRPGSRASVRPESRSASRQDTHSIRCCTPIGVAISDARTTSPIDPTSPIGCMGLAIQVPA